MENEKNNEILNIKKNDYIPQPHKNINTSKKNSKTRSKTTEPIAKNKKGLIKKK